LYQVGHSAMKIHVYYTLLFQLVVFSDFSLVMIFKFVIMFLCRTLHDPIHCVYILLCLLLFLVFHYAMPLISSRGQHWIGNPGVMVESLFHHGNLSRTFSLIFICLSSLTQKSCVVGQHEGKWLSKGCKLCRIFWSLQSKS
jgi:hypothetical protein